MWKPGQFFYPFVFEIFNIESSASYRELLVIYGRYFSFVFILFCLGGHHGAGRHLEILFPSV
jgi:hypothetical protein